jgi:hypothetical protein
LHNLGVLLDEKGVKKGSIKKNYEKRLLKWDGTKKISFPCRNHLHNAIFFSFFYWIFYSFSFCTEIWKKIHSTQKIRLDFLSVCLLSIFCFSRCNAEHKKQLNTSTFLHNKKKNHNNFFFWLESSRLKLFFWGKVKVTTTTQTKNNLIMKDCFGEWCVYLPP